MAGRRCDGMPRTGMMPSPSYCSVWTKPTSRREIAGLACRRCRIDSLHLGAGLHSDLRGGQPRELGRGEGVGAENAHGEWG